MIDYQEIYQSLNQFGKYVLECLRIENGANLNNLQLKTIKQLLENDFILIDEPALEDIELFGVDQNKHSIPNAPSAHGGRTKSDGKIHVYPYSKSFEGLDTKEIIKICIDDIIIHEVFHYIIRPDITEQELRLTENVELHDDFQHFIAEGLVQAYAEDFSQKHRLCMPKSNYKKNTNMARELMAGIEESKRDTIVFNSNYLQILQQSQNGSRIFEDFSANHKLRQNLIQKIKANHQILGVDILDIEDIVKHYDINDKLDELASRLEQKLSDQKQLEEYPKNEIL